MVPPGFNVESPSNRTDSVDDKWTENSPYLAALIMAIVVVIFFLILVIYCYRKKKLCFGTGQKVAAEVGIDHEEPNQGQRDFDLPPAYSTLSKK